MDSQDELEKRVAPKVIPELKWCKCSDLDADCDDVKDKFHCFMHDPEKGWCPYLAGVKK